MKNKPYAFGKPKQKAILSEDNLLPWPKSRKGFKSLRQGELSFACSGIGVGTNRLWQSNVQWPLECFKGMYGDGMTTDTHPTREGAEAVCKTLEEEGFGCMGEFYPIETWISEADQ